MCISRPRIALGCKQQRQKILFVICAALLGVAKETNFIEAREILDEVQGKREEKTGGARENHTGFSCQILWSFFKIDWLFFFFDIYTHHNTKILKLK